MMKVTCYPSCMIPFPGLILEVEVDRLLEHGGFSIARRVDKKFSSDDIIQMSDGSCSVRLDSTLREETLLRIPNLSTTMLRNAYSLQPAMYVVKMKSPEDDWKGGIVHACKFMGKAFKPNVSYLMVYLANNIQRQPVNYQRKFENRMEAESNQEYYEDLKNDIVANKFTKGTFYKGNGLIRIKHSPTMLNYWHFEIKLVNSKGEIIENAYYKPAKVPSQRNMKQSFVEYVWDNYLCKHFWVNKNPCETDLAMSLFEDNSICSLKRWVASHWTKCIFNVIPIVADS